MDDYVSDVRIKSELIDDSEESDEIHRQVIKTEIDSGPKRPLVEFDTYLECSVDVKNECNSYLSTEQIKKELSDVDDSVNEIDIQNHEVKLEYDPESSQETLESFTEENLFSKKEEEQNQSHYPEIFIEVDNSVTLNERKDWHQNDETPSGADSTGKNFNCDKCQFQCRLQSVLTRHKKKHSHERPFSCELCPFSTAYSYNLKIHKETHNSTETYACDECSYKTKFKRSLIRHRVVHTGKISCESCSYSAINNSILQNHMKTVHSNERPYACDKCPYKGKLKGDLTKHQLLHTGIRLFCDVCSFSTVHKENLKEHLKAVHSDERPFACDKCPFKTKLRKYLTGHLTTVHADERPYSCELCSYTAVKEYGLKNHMKTAHSNERPYACDKCEYKSKMKSHLTSHRRLVHAKERPYSCELCSYSSAEKISLRLHMEVNHISEKQYSCDKCPYKAKIKKYLARHQLVKHTNLSRYSCELCSFSSTENRSLRTHMKTKHSDEQPYVCDECPYKAKLKQSLNRHKKVVHRGERFSCEMCSYTSSEMRYIKKHILKKHRIEPM